MEIEYQKRLKYLLRNTGDMALKRRAKEIITSVDPKKKDKILDVGCGDGYYLHLLSGLRLNNLKLTGSDFDTDALKSARSNLGKKRIKLDFGDLMKELPYKPKSFDKVIMSEVAEHLPDDVKGLKEINRILKKEGILGLSVPNANYPFLWDPVNWILEHSFKTHIKSGFWAGLWNNHKRLYTPMKIKRIVEKAGFRVLKVSSLTYWCLPFNHYLVNLTARAIHSGKINPNLKVALNKYEIRGKKPLILRVAFKFANAVDRLNDIIPVKNSGVGVFILAKKI